MKFNKEFTNSITKDELKIIKKAEAIYNDWLEFEAMRKKMREKLKNSEVRAVFERLKDR